MYSTILLLSSALGAGGDVVPAGGWGLGPRDTAGCHGTPATPPPCCDMPAPSLLDRWRAKAAAKKQECCPAAPAPAAEAKPAAPAPAQPPTSVCCPESCAPRVGLLDRLRARLAARKHKDCCDPCGGGCAPTPTPEQKPPAGSPPPKEMPKPKEKTEAPTVSPNPAVAVPVPPSAPSSSSNGTPY